MDMAGHMFIPPRGIARLHAANDVAVFKLRDIAENRGAIQGAVVLARLFQQAVLGKMAVQFHDGAKQGLALRREPPVVCGQEFPEADFHFGGFVFVFR